MASHLLKSYHFWEDIGEGSYSLNYLRDKEKREVDFLVLRDKNPWFTVECKIGDSNLSSHYKRFQQQLNCPHIQVVKGCGIFRKIDSQTWVMSSDYLLIHLV